MTRTTCQRHPDIHQHELLREGHDRRDEEHPEGHAARGEDRGCDYGGWSVNGYRMNHNNEGVRRGRERPGTKHCDGE
jgi:hypothetical protein